MSTWVKYWIAITWAIACISLLYGATSCYRRHMENAYYRGWTDGWEQGERDAKK